MMGDRRLRELEGLREVADTDLVCGGEGVDDRHARRVGESLEAGRELVSFRDGERLGPRTAADRGRTAIDFIDGFQYIYIDRHR
jgi:hypothetical protein